MIFSLKIGNDLMIYMYYKKEEFIKIMKKIITTLNVIAIFTLFYVDPAISMIVNGPRGPVKVGAFDGLIVFGATLIGFIYEIMKKNKHG